MTWLKVVLAACAVLFAASGLLAASGSAFAQAVAPVELRVQTFNVWYGGEQVNFPTVIDAIRKADADIVGIQEPDGNLERIAAAAGYAHVDTRRNIISRYPIFDSGVGVRNEPGPAPYGIAALDSNALHAWVMVRPGYVVAFANTHLPSDPYGPEAVRDGASLENVLDIEERTRMPSARPLMALAKLPDTIPLFLTGDFNTPSHLDWTAAMQRVRPDAIRFPIVWPVTHALEGIGLRDSYRQAHPDPNQHPGHTWTAGMPHPYVRPGETIDRIDFIFTAGPSETLSSQIMGEPGGVNVDIPVSPYPSDHRSVVSTFRVTPAPASALISVEPRSAAHGADLLVRGFDPASEGWRAVIVRAGKVVTAKNTILTLNEPVSAWRRAGRFSTTELVPGEYDAVLLDAYHVELKRTRFAITDPDKPVSLQAVSQRVPHGAPVRARWSNAPGNRFDWVGVFQVGAALGDAVSYAYVDARYAGEIDISTRTENGLLPPGPYELRFMRDDSPTTLARAPFSIR